MSVGMQVKCDTSQGTFYGKVIEIKETYITDK